MKGEEATGKDLYMMSNSHSAETRQEEQDDESGTGR